MAARRRRDGQLSDAGLAVDQRVGYQALLRVDLQKGTLSVAAARGLHANGFEAHEQRSGCEYLLTVCVSMHRAHTGT